LHTPTPAACRGFIPSEEGVVLPATADLNEEKLLLTLNSRIGNNTAPAQQVFFFCDEDSAANKCNLGFTADWFLERACDSSRHEELQAWGFSIGQTVTTPPRALVICYVHIVRSHFASDETVGTETSQDVMRNVTGKRRRRAPVVRKCGPSNWYAMLDQ
jgi:hypothetical protein